MASLAPSSGSRGAIQPLNVEQIARKAQDYDYDPCVPLRQWLRAAGTLLKEVCLYILYYPELAESDLETG